MQTDPILGIAGIILANIVGLGMLRYLAKNWDLSFRMAAVVVALGLMLIGHGIVQDWVHPPEEWEWAHHMWGQITEHDEDIRRCGADYSRCTRQ